MLWGDKKTSDRIERPWLDTILLTLKTEHPRRERKHKRGGRPAHLAGETTTLPSFLGLKPFMMINNRHKLSRSQGCLVYICLANPVLY